MKQALKQPKTTPTTCRVKRPRKVKSAPVPVLTYHPGMNNVQAAQEFAKSVPKVDNGANDYLEKFLLILEGVLERPSFTLRDVQYASKAFLIPPHEVALLFEKWRAFMSLKCKLETVHGAYDEPVFIYR